MMVQAQRLLAALYLSIGVYEPITPIVQRNTEKNAVDQICINETSTESLTSVPTSTDAPVSTIESDNILFDGNDSTNGTSNGTHSENSDASASNGSSSNGSDASISNGTATYGPDANETSANESDASASNRTWSDGSDASASNRTLSDSLGNSDNQTNGDGSNRTSALCPVVGPSTQFPPHMAGRRCFCLDKEEESIAALNVPIEALLLNKKDLSSYKRTKTSAGDDRPSSHGIGSVAIFTLVVIFLVIILCDYVNFTDRLYRRHRP